MSLVEFDQEKKPTLKGSAWTGLLNLSSLSLFSFSEPNKALDTNWWRVLIFLPQEPQTRSDFILSSQYSIGNPTLSHVPVCDDHIKWHWNEPDCIEGWNKFSVRIWSPWEPNLTHRRQLSLTEGESNFLPLPVFFFGVSSAIAKVTRVLAIRASCFNISRENLGQASQACYQSTLISGTSFFTQWNFPSSGRSTNEIYERSLQALLSSALRGFASRSLI